MANCPLWAAPGDEEVSWVPPNKLMTDKDGCFIIYSSHCELEFLAAPGYPFSAIGLRFAQANKGFVNCEAKVVKVPGEGPFYALTCPRQSTYDGNDFRKFVESEWTRWRKEPRSRYVAPAKAWEGPRGSNVRDRYGVREEYHVRVVSPKGAAIPGAAVQFTAWDQNWNDNTQTVLTDKKGECVLFESLLSGENKKYFDGVRRWLTLDIPGYAVGPVPCRLQKHVLNIITAKEAACVRGRIVDGNGNGLRAAPEVRYANDNDISFEFSFLEAAPDGTFEIGRRDSPGEPFWLTLASSLRRKSGAKP